MTTLVWMGPTLAALFLYGVGQGLVKKWIADVPPGRFCLFFVVAKAIVNLTFFATQQHPDPFSEQGRTFMWLGIGAYLLDGAAWILYFESIVAGPITIVGTLSAAYPALTVLFARFFLNEALRGRQYAGIVLVILGCIGLSYSPPDPDGKPVSKRWIPLAAAALLLWGIAQTIVKYAYGKPGSSEVNMALFNTLGGAATLGFYGLLRGLRGAHSLGQWGRSFLPMGMMAGADLAVIIASKKGPISIVTPVSGAYPVVTLGFAALVLKEKITWFQGLCVVMIIVGIVIT